MGSDELILLAHPTHRLVRRASASIADLRDTSLIVHDGSTGEDGWLPAALKRGAATAVSVPTLDAVKQLVRLNAGVAVMPPPASLSHRLARAANHTSSAIGLS